MLKVSMFCQASLATPRKKSFSELMYFSAFFPVLSMTIFSAIARRLSCISYEVNAQYIMLVSIQLIM